MTVGDYSEGRFDVAGEIGDLVRDALAGLNVPAKEFIVNPLASAVLHILHEVEKTCERIQEAHLIDGRDE